MVGLQGSGKTTTTGKLARKLQKAGYKVMLVGGRRLPPGAPCTSSRCSGEKLGVPVFARRRRPTRSTSAPTPPTEAGAPRALDFVIYDTAGRLTIDEPLMKELDDIKRQVQPANMLPRHRRDDRPGRGHHRQDVRRAARSSPA